MPITPDNPFKDPLSYEHVPPVFDQQKLPH
jgi:hypothetical protein